MKDKSTKKLNSELKIKKSATISLIIVLALLLCVCIYGLIAKENKSVFISLMIIPFSLSSIVFLNYRNMKKIKNELETRK
ncbi:hypothetical protein [Formosa algae]|uniref:Redox-active disulfide protein 2 n=1 Tax=Formosa algae TaxID=225843 RepID=A0A9X0YL29_9FLAO|nr:hypothetical protein [Formosa algae]MBP1838853.1 hypothetical protein [Formosa algae]MDQ0333630.1 hypothetical protein [Formosa algae]OEI78823.1 hypothetical protein AST99_16725 [Formosa algae]PNW26443.1 hypothetical protein BKP44_17105 [Formosa algae]